jgi:XRE family transcriptional regulator, regulator of sulfur utilization
MKKISRRVASALKLLREIRGWSLDKAAEATGVSKAMLGQIEREESSPTVATLWKLAKGFDVSFSAFLEESSSGLQKPIYRSKKEKYLSSSDRSIQITTIFPFDKQLNCEIFSIELLPHSEHASKPHQIGVIEQIVVVKGTLEILLNGIWQTLRKNDGLRFNADQSHQYKNSTSIKIHFYNIIHYA